MECKTGPGPINSPRDFGPKVNGQFINVTVIVPTLGRVQQAIELHNILHNLVPRPKGINFVFQEEIERQEFNNSSECARECSSLINTRSVIAARNFGINAAKTDYIAFIDDDCRPANGNWLSELVEPLDNQDIALTTGAVLGWHGASGNLPFLKRAFLLLPPFLEPIGKTDSSISSYAKTVAGGNFAARRIELQSVGGFANNFPSPCIYEETEMAIRLTSVFNKRIWYSAKAQIIHDQSLSGGMRSDGHKTTELFIINQRRILLECVYGKSKATEARMSAFKSFRAVKTTVKFVFRRSSAK